MINIRRFDFAGDAGALVAMMPDLYEHNFPGLIATREFLARRRQALRTAVRDPAQLVLVLDAPGGPAGFLWLVVEQDYAGGRRGEISAIYVAPELRGQGWGRRLMDEADLIFRSWGCLSARLMVTASNTAALSLYQSIGYEVTRHEMEKKF